MTTDLLVIQNSNPATNKPTMLRDPITPVTTVLVIAVVVVVVVVVNDVVPEIFPILDGSIAIAAKGTYYVRGRN